jgi:leishmanolysin
MAQVRTVAKLTFSGTKCNNGQGGVPLPSSIITNGLTNDILIIFTARPSINTQAIATTSVCYSEATYGRPVIAQINMDPNLFFRGQTYVQQKGTLLHELTHALGFSSDRFNTFVDQNTGARLTTASTQAVTASYTDSSGTTNTQSVTYLTTPKLVAAMKSHFGCSSLPTGAVPGVALEEFGSSGTAGSHFEKRVYFNELMAGSAASQAGTSYAVSAFTLAFLDDSGWYKANSSLVVDGATPLIWGKNTGCSMPTQRCESWSLGSLSSSYYCSSNLYTSSQQSVCTFNLRAKGSCSIQTYTSNLPGYYEHIRGSRNLGGVDQLMDYCPYVMTFTNGDCTNTANSGIGRGFEYFGAGSACFDSNVVTALDTQQKTADARCFQYNCKRDTGILQVKVGSNWFDCPADQSSKRITSGFEVAYNGYVTCPSNGYYILCQSGQSSSSTPGSTPTPTKCDNFLGLFCNSAVQSSVAWLLVISLISLWL